jgi:hypothetical protein
VLGFLALVTGVLALVQMRTSRGEGGKGRAMFGIGAGGLACVANVLLCVLSVTYLAQFFSDQGVEIKLKGPGDDRLKPAIPSGS